MKKRTVGSRLASLIQEYENGRTIQKSEQNKVGAEWVDTEFPEWNISLFDYRVKPKEKRQPPLKKRSGFIIKDSSRDGNTIVPDATIASMFKLDGAYSCEIRIKGVNKLDKTYQYSKDTSC